MARHHCFWMVGLLGLGLALLGWQNADAQPGRKKTAQTPAPIVVRLPSTPVIGPSVPLVSAGAAPVTHNYHVYPQTFVGMSGYSSFPLAANPAFPITYAFSYYAPLYVPNTTERNGYLPFSVFTFGDGVTMPFVPRINHEPPSPEATIEILMPRSDAVLLVEDTKTSSTGLRRYFTSPPLEPGDYNYNVTAVWQNGSKEMRAVRTVRISPGGKYFVDFNKIELASTEK